jgi:glyoxylase-like metal-dependent hydrolase (beta-lactamase superfamily II)
VSAKHENGIHQVPGVHGANVYLLTQAGPLTLIDSGLPRSGRAVVDFMSALGYRPQALERILLTHKHPDHAGGGAYLRETTGARLYAHAGDVEDAGEGQILRTMRGRMTVSVDCLVGDGDLLEGGIRVVHTGGHTAGSVAYQIEDAGALFLGDMAVNNIDRLSRPIAFSNEDNRLYEVGLARLAALDAGAGYFGHGPPLPAGLRAALQELQARPRSPLPVSLLRYVALWLRRRLP